MSYRGSRGKSGGGFSVTTEWDGSRSFEGDSRRGAGGHYRSKRYRGRGSYSRGRGRGYGGFRDGNGPNPRSRLDEDGDISMSDDVISPSNSRYNPYGSRPNNRRTYGSSGGKLAMDREGSSDLQGRIGSSYSQSRYRRGKTRGKSFHHSDSGWYRVTIPNSSKTEKDVLLEMINNHVEVPFQPIQYHCENRASVFYLSDSRAAESVRAVDKKITLPSGMKIIIIVRPCPRPAVIMDEPTIEKLKVCMSERYDVAAKSLNLSSLYQDQKFSAEGIHLALNKYNVMGQVVKIIKENIPELTSLDLSSNRLMSLDNLRPLVTQTPNLTYLNLSKNNLKSVDELSKIKAWKLTELVLDSNDLCDYYREKAAYISAVRKHFPKVLKLDGHELPPPITFDLESSTELPPAKDNYFKNDVVRDLVVKFVKQYYEIFDSEDREKLLPAYHNEATFSMTFGYNRMISGKQPSWPDLAMESRNLLKVKDSEKRQKMMKQSKLSIIAFLNSRSFPKTTHDPHSFHVDVNVVTNELLIFAVTGIFKEGKSDRGTIRSFSRVFTTIPQGGGIVITNDMVSITNAGPEQVQGAFKNPAPTPSSSPVLGTSPQQNPLGSNGARLAMVQQFSVQSGMNLDWSTKCLEQNEWDYEKAAKIFTDLQANGKIPPEAFNK